MKRTIAVFAAVSALSLAFASAPHAAALDDTTGPGSFGPESHTTPGAGPEPAQGATGGTRSDRTASEAVTDDTDERSPPAGPSAYGPESHTTPGAGPEPAQGAMGGTRSDRTASGSITGDTDERSPTTGPGSFGPESHTTPGAGPEPR